ncbi:MAG: pyridoxamine 5'-phosphate oxidase family protein [Rhizomicrobium sp.]
MSQIPEKISTFIASNHVLSLCIADENGPWAASCFYVYDPTEVGFIILTSPQTRHGKRMLEAPEIAGTIAGQPDRIRDIRGLQYTARARTLDGEARKLALWAYSARHPAAKFVRAEVWLLELRTLKYTDNSLIFGQKTYWQRDETTP